MEHRAPEAFQAAAGTHDELIGGLHELGDLLGIGVLRCDQLGEGQSGAVAVGIENAGALQVREELLAVVADVLVEVDMERRLSAVSPLATKPWSNPPASA